MAEWYLATYQNGVFSSDLGIIQASEDSVYKLKDAIDSGESPEKKDWLRITITNNTVEEWDNSSWTQDTSLTGLVNNSTYWVYGLIVKYVIVTNSEKHYLEDLTTLNDIGKANITSVIIGNSVETIGTNAFDGINDSVIFIIPESVLTKLNEADPSPNLTYGSGKDFFGTSTAILVKDYPYYTIVTNDEDQIHYLPIFSRDNNTITGIILDSTVVTIINTPTITRVIIGNSVTVIGNKTFENCTSLASLTIGDSVETIDQSAFYNCSSLASVTIGDSVTRIGNSAFGYCSSLASVIIPESVTSIDHGAFAFCSSLASVIIPDSVTSIGSAAFYACRNLASVTIGDSVKTIGDGAFAFCSRLEEVNIPDSVETIGTDAFYRENYTFTPNITISQSTVRRLKISDKYNRGAQYPQEIFFGATVNIIVT